MSRPIIFEYLELACYGKTPEQIAKRYGIAPSSARHSLLMASREVARMGFWKFHIAAHTDIPAFSKCLLERIHRFGLLQRSAA